MLLIQLLAPTGALYLQLVDPRLKGAREATLSLPTGDWNYAAELEDVVSCVVPER